MTQRAHTHPPAVSPIMTCPRCRLDMAAPLLQAALYALVGHVAGRPRYGYGAELSRELDRLLKSARAALRAAEGG